jgi:hypothetical protein
VSPVYSKTKYGSIPGIIVEINKMFEGTAEQKVDFTKMGAAKAGFKKLRGVLNEMNGAMKQSEMSKPDHILTLEKNVTAVKRIAHEAVKIDKDASVMFKGGKLVVEHNLRKVEMKINVHIDSKTLGQAIIATDLSTKSDRGYIPTGPTKGIIVSG